LIRSYTGKYPPISSSYKIFIIDEVHMLTKEAFNALLKTLEEPPSNVIFILATTDSHKIPDTILSRVLRFDFKKIMSNQISDHMKNILKQENVEYEELALDTIAYKADGSIRDALSMLDKIIAYSSSNISYDLVKESLGIIEDEVYLNLFYHILSNNEDKLLHKIKDVINSGYSLDNFVSGFNIFLSQSLVFLSGYKKNQMLNDKTKAWLDENKKHITNRFIMEIIDSIQEYELKAKYLLQPDIALESLFVKLSSINKNGNKISAVIEEQDSTKNEPQDATKNEEKEAQSKLTEESKVILEDKKNDIPTKDDKIDLKENESQDAIKNEEKETQSKLIEESKVILDKQEKEADNLSKNNDIDLEQIDPIKNWTKIIAVIDKKDARVSSFLEDAKLKLDNNLLIIELGDSSNDFTKKTLDNKLDLIIASIESISNQKFKIQIESNTNKANVDDEESHPLLESLKEKFNGDTIR